MLFLRTNDTKTTRINSGTILCILMFLPGYNSEACEKRRPYMGIFVVLSEVGMSTEIE